MSEERVPTREELEKAAVFLDRWGSDDGTAAGQHMMVALYAVSRVLAMRPATELEIRDNTKYCLRDAKDLEDFAVQCYRACERANGIGEP